MVSCEHGDKHSGSIKDVEFPDYVSDYQVLKKDGALTECIDLVAK